MVWRVTVIIVSLGVLLASACRPAATPTRTPAPTPVVTATPTTTATPAPSATPASLAEYFPPGAGRDTIILYCGNCHSLVRPLLTRKSPAAWVDFISTHPGTEFVPEEAMKSLLEYVSVNFGPDDTIPSLPPELVAW